MSLFWPIFWFSSMLSAVIAFAVAALRENSRQKAVALAMKPKPIPMADVEGSPDESMDNLDSFPVESFDFDDGTQK